MSNYNPISTPLENKPNYEGLNVDSGYNAP